MNKTILPIIIIPGFILTTGFNLKEPSIKAEAGNCSINDTIQKSLILQPYRYASGSFYGPEIKASPDPLVNYHWPNPKAADDLEIYTLKPVKVNATNPASFQNLQSLTTGKPDVTVKGNGSIVLDFGQENAAWLEIDSPDLTDTIQMSISEFNEPAVMNIGSQNRIKTKTPVKYGNTYRLELNRQLYEGVRFSWIHVNKFSRPWHITGVRLVCQIKPVNYNGSFSCSDSLLTRIWYTGAYVVKLNLLKDYFGAILMERSDRFSWTGDAHPSQAASMAAFGNYDFVKKNIEFTSNQDNGIASYSLIWVLSLVDYYNYTGDTATLGKLTANACKKLEKAYANWGTNPNLRFFGWDERLGAGFENASCAESQKAYKMLSVRAWQKFSEAMKSYGRKDLAEKYAGYASKKVSELKQDNKWYSSFGVHAAADAINAGFTDNSEKEALFDGEFSDRLNRLSYSPFNQYFILQAMGYMGKYDDALCSVRDCWGGQIKYGGTTFFEVYRPSWNSILNKNGAPPNNQCGYTSLAHPWGAGVIKWLTEEVLGIKPTMPGFSKFDILPHLGRTLTSVAGKVTTPKGEITADFNVTTGICNVLIPQGTIARIGLPKVEKRIESISANGKTAWNGKFITVNGIGDASEDADFVYLLNVQPGKYNISVAYKGTTPHYDEPPFVYHAELVRTDSLTKGSWGGKYGSKGYVLCIYNGTGKDLIKLPSFVASVYYCRDDGKERTNHIYGNKTWATGVTDSRALSAGPDNSFPRNIGCIYTFDPKPGMQTMTVDIKNKESQAFQISLYFVDWDHKDRRTALELFDLDTKKLIAPVGMVRNYRNGKYLVFKCKSSVRFRIDQVRGENAVLSGIFFD